MDPESKKLLEATYELADKNNRMLKKIRSVQKRAFLVSFVKFIIFIGITLGAFYYIEPYLQKLFNVYNALSSNDSPINSNTNSILDIVKGVESKIPVSSKVLNQ